MNAGSPFTPRRWLGLVIVLGLLAAMWLVVPQLIVFVLVSAMLAFVWFFSKGLDTTGPPRRGFEKYQCTKCRKVVTVWMNDETRFCLFCGHKEASSSQSDHREP